MFFEVETIDEFIDDKFLINTERGGGIDPPIPPPPKYVTGLGIGS